MANRTKYRLKYKLIFSIIFVLLLSNIIPVVVFYENIKLTPNAYFPVIIMALHTVYGIIACICKHSGDYFIFHNDYTRTSYKYSSFRYYSFSDEYENEYRFKLLVFFAVIPFYLPVIFFTDGVLLNLLPLLIFMSPQAIYFISWIFEVIIDAKEIKKQKKIKNKELKEQEKREELGYWK